MLRNKVNIQQIVAKKNNIKDIILRQIQTVEGRYLIVVYIEKALKNPGISTKKNKMVPCIKGVSKNAETILPNNRNAQAVNK